MQCKKCDAKVEVPEGGNSDLGAFSAALHEAHWGWVMAPDPGLGNDAYGVVPGWFYACPNCKAEDTDF